MIQKRDPLTAWVNPLEVTQPGHSHESAADRPGGIRIAIDACFRNFKLSERLLDVGAFAFRQPITVITLEDPAHHVAVLFSLFLRAPI